MSTDPAAAGTAAGFEPSLPYRLAPSVSVRPEPFGALVYDFRSRRLSFLKTPTLVRVVRTLGEHPDVASALVAADVPDHARYLRALAGLAETGMIEPRDDVDEAG